MNILWLDLRLDYCSVNFSRLMRMNYAGTLCVPLALNNSLDRIAEQSDASEHESIIQEYENFLLTLRVNSLDIISFESLIIRRSKVIDDVLDIE